MLLKKLKLLVLSLFATSVVLSACRGQTSEPVTFNAWAKYDVATLDPQLTMDSESVEVVENLFLQLTNYDPVTAEMVPEAASEWQVSDDGLVYTFKIRRDIPWVKHDPATNTTTQEVDPQGNLRFLSAYDFAYGIKRACDPSTGSYYSSIVGPLIKGCSEVLFAEDPENIPEELWDAIGARARDDETLVIELEFPAAYFLPMTSMWTLAAVPQWSIEAHGKAWIEAVNIVTNGRYVVHEWEHDVRRIFARNTLLPEDLQGDGNIERFVITVVPDKETGYELWLEGKVDWSSIPDEEMQTHLQRFPEKVEQIGDMSVSYISFRMTKPPFDDPRVRRAFSAAFDRELYVEEVLQGQGRPMIHFAPPGIFGAPPIDEVGLGFDPEFAREQLAEAGYPDCRNLPSVTLLGHSEGETFLKFVQAQWVKNLDCSEDQILIEQRPWGEVLEVTRAEVPDAKAPHMWRMGWLPDYPDENNWVGDVLWCKGANSWHRTCNEIDDLIVEAREEPNPQRRIELYRQIEEMFFGPEGEIPFFPFSLRVYLIARHPWLDVTSAAFGGQQWYNWSIDQEAQQAAQR